MLAPHELKSKSFSKSLKGYNPSEVDDYIEFLIDKYTELYRENSELERLKKEVAFSFWERLGETRTVVRFATSWSTRPEELEALRALL